VHSPDTGGKPRDRNCGTLSQATSQEAKDRLIRAGKGCRGTLGEGRHQTRKHSGEGEGATTCLVQITRLATGEGNQLPVWCK